MLINLKEIPKYERNDFINLIYPIIVSSCSQYYRDLEDWFSRVKKDLLENCDIYNLLIIMEHQDFKGFCIIKKSPYEKKICTLYVREMFRKQKVGTELCKVACELLGTNKPVISIPEDRLSMFIKFFESLGWKESRREIYYNL